MVNVTRPRFHAGRVAAVAAATLASGILAPLHAGPPPQTPANVGAPTSLVMRSAGSFDGDLRDIPAAQRLADRPAEPRQPSPGVDKVFQGLNPAQWHARTPLNVVGDVGLNSYVQAINSAFGFFRKTDGGLQTGLTFDSFMANGHFGNACDVSNQGDPSVLYDTFEDRWVIADVAYQFDGSNNIASSPGTALCIAVSKANDSGWAYYSLNFAGGFGDAPRLGIWPDGIYLSVNMRDYGAAHGFQNVRVYALNKMQMYTATPGVQVVTFDAPSGEINWLPSNAKLLTGAPPPGSPNYFTSVGASTNIVRVWKFLADWAHPLASTLTGPFDVTTATSWTALSPSTQAPSPSVSIETGSPQLMPQNQYSNVFGVESLWNVQTVGATATQSGIRYYQLAVTGGTVATNALQAFTYSPDASLWRFMPSIAVNSRTDVAIAYATSSGTAPPNLTFAGRIVTDPVNSITIPEWGGILTSPLAPAADGWGRHSATTIAPDGCTFWHTNIGTEFSSSALRTWIFSFAYPNCALATRNATLSGAITDSLGPALGSVPQAVSLGSRTASGVTGQAANKYTLGPLYPGRYPTLTVRARGYVPLALTDVVVGQGANTRDITLTRAPLSGCFVDTSQNDFVLGAADNVDFSSSPGDLKLVNSGGFATNGTFVSSVKDANPWATVFAHWDTITFNASVPAGTTLQFQVAPAWSDPNGSLSFVGPDGTSSTYFDNGASLPRFDQSDFLKYKAFFTSDGSATPTVHDVTVCYVNSTPPVITTQPGNRTISSGTSTTLTVAASGTPFFNYRWFVGQTGDTAHPMADSSNAPYTTPAITQTTSYWVRVSTAAGSVDSQAATVTVVPYAVFTDDPLTAGATTVKAVHVTELRTRIDQQRTRFGLTAFAWTDPALTGSTPIKAIHITELRTALMQAYAVVGMTAVSFTDPSLGPGTALKRVHIQELRDAVTALEAR
jgi:hypothetical protein